MRNRPPNYPKHAYATAHEFRSVKRKHVRAAIKAVEALRMGCAYLPKTATPVPAILQALEELKDACSVKNWGR